MPSNNNTTTSGTTFIGSQQYMDYQRQGAARRQMLEEIVADMAEDTTFPRAERIMKERHLNRQERLALHKPKKDWIATEKGEVCRSSCVLVVDDLIEMCK